MAEAGRREVVDTVMGEVQRGDVIRRASAERR